MKVLLIGLVAVLVCLSRGESPCPQLQQPQAFDESQYLGTWYAIRGIEHTPATGDINKKSKKCSEITIESKDDRTWEFNWKTKNKPSKHFTLKLSQTTPGLLESEKGGAFRRMQITKIADDSGIWGATLCRTNGNMSTVILSNVPKFEKERVDKVTARIAAQGLSVNNIFDRCVNT